MNSRQKRKPRADLPGNGKHALARRSLSAAYPACSSAIEASVYCQVHVLMLLALRLIVTLHLVKHLNSLKLHHLALAMQGQLGHVLRDALPADFKLGSSWQI